MANNYNVMAQYIVEKFIERVSGDDIEETFVEEAPEENKGEVIDAEVEEKKE